MRKQSFVLACTVALSLLGTGAARSENLLDVYQAAVKSDPVIREADARRQAALEVKPQARALLLPQVNIGGQFYTSNSDGEATFPQVNTNTGDIVSVGNKSSTDTSRYWDYSAQLTQTVFRWDQWQQLKRADSQVAVAEANYRAAQQDLLVRVSQAYFDVLAADDTLTAAEATLQAFSRQLEQSEKRFEVGLIAITDVQESRAAHDSATADVIAAKRALASANEALREIAGDTFATLVKPADDMPLNQPQPLDEQQWVTKALDENLAVIAARLNSEVAASNVKIAESGHLPTVDQFAQYNQNDRTATQTNQAFDPSGNLPPSARVNGSADSNGTSDVIGLRVNIPVFSGGGTSSKVREQVYLQRAAREKLDGTMRSAERQTRDAYLGVLAEKARVQALQQSVKSNQTALEATEAGFEVGTRTTVDVLDARRRLFLAQSEYARSRYNYLINIVKLKSASGALAPADLASINTFLTQPTTLPVLVPKPEG
jgi:outer membrane protein